MMPLLLKQNDDSPQTKKNNSMEENHAHLHKKINDEVLKYF